MDEAGAKALSVEIRELRAEHVACVVYRPVGEPTEMHAEIGGCFEQVRSWMRERGIETRTQTVGVITSRGGRMESYECCIRVPASVKAGSGEVTVKDLAGGRYSVLSMKKDPKVIGESIDRLYQEYVPHHGLRVDEARPTYEIYFEEAMDHCVPVL